MGKVIKFEKKKKVEPKLDKETADKAAVLVDEALSVAEDALSIAKNLRSSFTKAQIEQIERELREEDDDED